jgi:biopolymer transport protein ExbD
MRVVRVGVVAWLAASCISPVMKFGAGKSAKQAQRDTMSDFTPARLVPQGKWGGDVATRKIRVWADNQYRAQNVRWQQSFEEPLEFANLVLTPLFGLRLVAEYSAWERHAPGSTLADDITALAERDPGGDVFAVVGLTSSLPLVSATFEELGNAVVGGRHLVLRGYADLEERKQYADAFPDLRADERELALEQLRRHKTAVVLLHELGHNLGAGHDGDADTIMNASYSRRAGSFSAPTRDAMLGVIDQRLQRPSSRPDAGPTTATNVAQPREPGAATTVETKPREPMVRHAPVIIRVTKSGATIVEGKTLDAVALGTLLEVTFAEDPETQIEIRTDRKVPVGSVASVIDRAKAIGLTRFALGSTGQ